MCIIEIDKSHKGLGWLVAMPEPGGAAKLSFTPVPPFKGRRTMPCASTKAASEVVVLVWKQIGPLAGVLGESKPDLRRSTLARSCPLFAQVRVLGHGFLRRNRVDERMVFLRTL